MVGNGWSEGGGKEMTGKKMEGKKMLLGKWYRLSTPN
ncbi:hypothetical protein Rcae01_06603 [Novipirellula caenicola]|uniref:Uncharacterized protein n=1 Tax=Novipirellula caenicola TaxID=1536901 RepID=A0ABP9W2R1_9BACT